MLRLWYDQLRVSQADIDRIMAGGYVPGENDAWGWLAAPPAVAPVDYRQLLQKYMQHVLNLEGTTCIVPTNPGLFADVFTEAEHAALVACDAELT